MEANQSSGAVRSLRAGLAILFILLYQAGFAAANPLPEELAGLIDEALGGNQELLALEETARALRAEAPFAGSLQDPVVGIGIANLPVDTFDFDQEPMTQKLISLSQRIPWFGTLDLAEQGAELRAVEQEYLVASKRLALIRQVTEAWYDLSFVEQSLAINAELASIITQIMRVAETRYATGNGAQQDILLAQVQLSELIDESLSLRNNQRLIQDRIGSLLNREQLYTGAASRVAFPAEMALDRDGLTAASLSSSPLIGAARTAVMRAEIEVQLAEKDYLPDLDVRVSYGQRDDDPVTGLDRADFVSAGINFTVPLWQSRRQDSRLAASEKRLSAARKALLGVQRTLPHRVDAVLSEIATSRENYRLVNEAIGVQAAQLADSTRASYAVGEAEFSSLLNAQVRQLKVELNAERYKYQHLKKLSELEETVGRPLAMREERE